MSLFRRSFRTAITAPQAIVVSGDLVRGLPLNAANHAAELANQYAVAEDFLVKLTQRFLSGDRSRVVIIPGNHDVDWNTAFQALQPVPPAEIPPNLAALLHKEDSDYRWDWKTRALYRIADRALYDRRLEAFWTFFEKFYRGVDGLFKVRARSDANLFIFCDGRIGVAAYNSCHGNDCFAYHGMIRREVVAQSHLDLHDSGKVFDLLMAVWHHSIEGPPYRTDYMDVDVIRGMIGRGYRLGLYGHQHKAQATPHQIWLPDRERMAAVSAGSLCAGHHELPIGAYRQYNVLEIAPDFKSVRVHVRSMSVANLFSRGRLMDFGDKSFADLDWDPPRNVVGGRIDVNAARLTAIVEEAELASRSGDHARAIDLLLGIETPPASYGRQLLLTSAQAAQNWNAVIHATLPPSTIEELIYRVEAFNHLGQTAHAIAALDEFEATLGLPKAEARELRRRITTQEKISK